jgi:glycosyltransferase involved in cell wall biosynthesis
MTIMRNTSDVINVCFLIDELGVGGTELQLLALIENLDRQRVQPFLCLLRGANTLPPESALPACPTFHLDVQSFRHPSVAAKAKRFISFVRENQIDVVQAFFPDSTYFGVPLARCAGVPVVIRTRRDVGHWVKRHDRFLGRIVTRLVDATLTNGPSCSSSIIRDAAAKRDSVFEIPNIVDITRFEGIRAFGDEDSSHLTRKVGIVANLRAIKNIAMLAEAAAQLPPRFENVQFEIAGEGLLRNELEQLARSLGIAERFHLKGRVDDIPAFLADLDVAVLCSNAEGASNAILEYMAAGRPIVATDVGGNADLIHDGETGLLVPVRDASALATALTTLLDDHALATRLAANARQTVQHSNAPQIVADQHAVLYRDLLAGKSI